MTKFIISLVLVATLCGVAASPVLRRDGSEQVAASGVPAWSRVDDFAYQLQDVSLRALGRSRFDLVIVDYSRDGSEATRWTAAQIARLRASPGGPKRVLAYVSIGEAESYRWYWQSRGTPVTTASPTPVRRRGSVARTPSGRGATRCATGTPSGRRSSSGLPGATSTRSSPPASTACTSTSSMATSTGGPAASASSTARRRGNAWSISSSPWRSMRAPPPVARASASLPRTAPTWAGTPSTSGVVTGIGQEDTWYDDERRRPLAETTSTVRGLLRFERAGKLVLCTDYCRRAASVDRFYRLARSRDFVPYATVRDLDRLTVNGGHAPD